MFNCDRTTGEEQLKNGYDEIGSDGCCSVYFPKELDLYGDTAKALHRSF